MEELGKTKQNIALFLAIYVILSILSSLTLELRNSTIFIICFSFITILFGVILFIYLSKISDSIQEKYKTSSIDESENVSLEENITNNLDIKEIIEEKKPEFNIDDYIPKWEIKGLVSEITNILNQVVQVASNIENIAENSYSLLDFVKDVQNVGIDSLNSTQSSNGFVNNMIQEIGNTLNVSNNLKEAIDNLRQSSDFIGDIINNITSAAKQTHLLALNTSIEAARSSGNQAGFSVIANEMAKLATQSEGSAHEISKVLASIQRQVYDSFELVNYQQSCMSTISDKGNETITVINEVTEKTENVAQKISEAVCLLEEQMDIIGGVAMTIANTANTASQLCASISDLGN